MCVWGGGGGGVFRLLCVVVIHINNIHLGFQSLLLLLLSHFLGINSRVL